MRIEWVSDRVPFECLQKPMAWLRHPWAKKTLNAPIASFRSTLKTIIRWASHLTIIFILRRARCPFGLRTSAMICQRSTKAVIYIFTQAGFSADVYLDDFYGAQRPSLAENAFATLQSICDTLGLASSPEKDSPPAFEKVCLGILVNTKDFTLRVPD